MTNNNLSDATLADAWSADKTTSFPTSPSTSLPREKAIRRPGE